MTVILRIHILCCITYNFIFLIIKFFSIFVASKGYLYYDLILSSMYISSVSVTFSSKDNLSLYATVISLDYVVGSTLLHALDFVFKSPIIKSYLKNNYYIINLSFKYSNISDL